LGGRRLNCENAASPKICKIASKSASQLTPFRNTLYNGNNNKQIGVIVLNQF